MKTSFTLLVCAALLILFAGCSTYAVTHTETDANGKVYSTRIVELIPPGGKEISNGTADIGINKRGDWHVKIGAKTETDATGTAALIDHLIDKAVANGVAAATGGVAQ